MKVRRYISLLLLAIYVMSSTGGMLSVILCHCTRSTHIQTHHCCCDHCHSQGEGIKLPDGCNCYHDHSTEINLYNYERTAVATILPAICTILPDMQQSDKTDCKQPALKHLVRRKIPLSTIHIASAKGLRAPPVIA